MSGVWTIVPELVDGRRMFCVRRDGRWMNCLTSYGAALRWAREQ